MWVHLCGCVCPFVLVCVCVFESGSTCVDVFAPFFWCVFVRLSLVASAIASVRFPGHRRIACPSNWQPDRGGNSHNSHGQGRTPLLRPLWEILTIRYLLHFPLTFPRIFSFYFSSFYEVFKRIRQKLLSTLFPVTIYFVGKILMLLIEVLKLGESKILLPRQNESQISLLIFLYFWNFCIYYWWQWFWGLLASNT